MTHVAFRFRPLSGDWPHDGQDYYQASRFKASYTDTLNLLDDELRRLGVTYAVIELDIDERELRHDGLPRANARPRTPRVRLSFDHPEIGPLQYPCDTFADYRDNLRAIGKTLEAQRAMERYGATRMHQQYRGWKTLPAGDGFSTVGEAVAFLAEHSGMDQAAIRNGGLTAAYRAAAKRLHPDVGGDERQFHRLQLAKQRLDQA